MYLKISKEGELSLEELDVTSSFYILEASDAEIMGEAIIALKAIAEPAEDNHYWLDIESIISLSALKNDKSWTDAFWQMLNASEPYGYLDKENGLLKAHLETK